MKKTIKYLPAIHFVLLLVLGSFLQQTKGLRCHKCTKEACEENDNLIETCSYADPVCMVMQLNLKDVPITNPDKYPIVRGCYSAKNASCVGDTNNKCYAFKTVREPCDHIIRPILIEKINGTSFIPITPELVDLILGNLDGTICACITDLCNNDILSLSPDGGKGTTAASKSSRTMSYGNLKLCLRIGILFMVLNTLLYPL